MPDISEIIISMKKKIPILPLTIQLIIVKSVYSGYNPNNTTLVLANSSDYETYLIAFWAYYPLLCVITGIWEAAHAYSDYKKKYPTRTEKERIGYTILSSMISIWIFIVTCYYIENGVPFSLLFDYNTIAANIIFYMSYGLVSLITYLEHFKWPKLIKVSDLNDNKQSNILTYTTGSSVHPDEN